MLLFESLVVYIYICYVLRKWVCQKSKKGKAAYLKKVQVIGFQKKKKIADHVPRRVNLSPSDNHTFYLLNLL